jgi:long-chain fatty acid transport protein
MKSRISIVTAAASALLTLAVSGPAMATNGYFTHGVGTESKGMAGTGIGSNAMRGPIIVASNPALAVFADDSWEVGLSIFSPMRSYKAGSSFVNGSFGAFTIGEGRFDSSSEYFPIPYVAKNWRMDNGNALTFVFYGRGGMNTDWDSSSTSAWYDLDPLDANPIGQQYDGTFGGQPFNDVNAGVDLSQAFLSLNYAGKIGDNFAWGIGPIFAIQMFEATGVKAYQPFTKTFNECFFFEAPGTCDPTPQNLSNNGHEMSTGYGGAAGIWWGISDSFSVGLSYQSKLSMSEFDDYADLFAEAGGFDIPASTKLGFSFGSSDSVRFNFDIERTEYSEIGSVGNPMTNLFSCAFPVYGGVLGATGSPAAALAAAQAAGVESCLGGSSGGGFGWEDMTTYKAGIEWAADESTTWRFGYSFGEQPIRAPSITFNILAPGVMEQHITLGMTKRNDDGGAWNFSLMYAPSKSIEAPNPFDPTQIIELEMSQFEFEFSYLW